MDIESWFENLPNACPPADAIVCNGMYYRFIKDIIPAESDFYSQRKLFPEKEFIGIDECLTMSLSVFDNLECAKNKLKLPKFKKYHIAELNLTSMSGLMKKTFGPSHFSWWRSKDYDITKSTVVF